jgi:hypothetical protein
MTAATKFRVTAAGGNISELWEELGHFVDSLDEAHGARHIGDDDPDQRRREALENAVLVGPICTQADARAKLQAAYDGLARGHVGELIHQRAVEAVVDWLDNPQRPHNTARTGKKATVTNPPSACPVAALIPALAECLEQQKACPEEDVGNSQKWDILHARQAALVTMAETSMATSLKGAALQLLLAKNVIAGLHFPRAADSSYDGRTSDELERAGMACVYSALSALSGIGGELPAIIVHEYAPAGWSPFAVVRPGWQEPDDGRWAA